MITLTTPYDPGDIDPGTTYSKVQVVKSNWDYLNKEARLQWQYGTKPDTVFVAGEIKPNKLVIREDDYDALIAYVSQVDETCENAWDRAMHQYLLDKSVVVGSLA